MLTAFAPNPVVKYDKYFAHLDQLRLEEFLFWERDRVITDLPFTPKLLMEYLVRLGVKSPEIVFKQAVLETGWFSSYLFRTNHNLFGMNYPRMRPTTALFKCPKGFAYYQDWRQSVRDYLLWQQYKEQWHDTSEYYQFLKKVGYAEDHLYTNKLQSLNTKIYNQMATKIFSTKDEITFHQEYDLAQLKLHVEYPNLSTGDILKCEMYVNELSHVHEMKLIIDTAKRKALVIRDGIAGFIQKKNEQLIAVYKDGSSENITQRVSLQKLFDHYKIFEIKEDDVSFNFCGVVQLVNDGCKRV
jgi:hypothetical protein